jgi:hypothetical protein
LTGGFLDGSRDESDTLLSLIVCHPGRNQEDFAMPNDAGAPIMACSGNLVKLRRWCVSRSQRGSSKPSRCPLVGKKPLDPRAVEPRSLFEPMGIFCLKYGDSFNALSGFAWTVCRRFTGP